MLLSARKLLSKDPIEIKNNIRGPGFKVLFEDNETVVMSGPDIVLSRYYWEFIKKLNMKITSNLAITKFYDGGYYTSGSHKDYLETVYKIYIKEYVIPNGLLDFKIMEDSWKVMFEIMNALYSELQYNILEYGVSLSILDFIDLQKDTELIKAIDVGRRDNLNPTHVETVGGIVKDVLVKNPDNNLSKLYNCGVTNKTQVGHTIGRRGFVTDINNMIYSEAVDSNLSLGLDGFYDLSCESAVMAKALKLQEFGIKYSEWLQRELHLSAMSIGSVKLVDCGNRYYHDWYIKDKNDLSLIEGTNILVDGKEVEADRVIHSNLIDTIVPMRRVNDCLLLKSGHVCYKCLGAATYSMPSFASTSHTLLTLAMSVIGQLMLSAKHHTDSTILKDITLNSITSKYFTTKNSDFYIKEGKDIQIHLSQDSYYGFRLLSTSARSKISNIDTSKFSKIDRMFVSSKVNNNNTKEIVDIKLDGRYGILDQDFIIHSLDNTTLSSNGEYIIDMTGYKGRVLYLENKEFAYDQFNSEFKSLLLSYGGKKKNTTVEKAITDIFNYLNTKLNVNIKIVEVMVAGLTIESRADLDYSIGLNRETREVISYKEAILNRTIGVSLGFQEQKTILNNPSRSLQFKPYNPLEEVWNMKNIPKKANI